MQDAWIQLQCPNCDEQWEANPADLDEPAAEFTCDHCGATNHLSEFAKTTRDFEVLEEFQS